VSIRIEALACKVSAAEKASRTVPMGFVTGGSSRGGTFTTFLGHAVRRRLETNKTKIKRDGLRTIFNSSL
jgi:hypothetical protein